MAARDFSRGGLLDADDPRLDESYEEIASPLAGVSVRLLFSGDRGVVISYVRSWRASRLLLLKHVHSEYPELSLPLLTVETLDQAALGAPFSPWARSDNGSNGLAMHLIARLRSDLAGSTPARPLVPAPMGGASPEPDPESVIRFSRQVSAALAGRESTAAQIVDAFDLSTAELGRLFGVSRQAAAQWLTTDMPADRQAKASVVVSITDLLSHRLKPGRLPGVARRTAAAYGDLSMLDMIAADRHEELLDSVRASFDFAKTA